VAEELSGGKCGIGVRTYSENKSGESSEQPKGHNLRESVAEFGHLILTDESAFSLHRRMLSRAMKCYANSVCRLLKIAEKPEKERAESLKRLSEFIVDAASYANLVLEVYEALAAVSGGLPEGFAYLYALSSMLWYPFLRLYVLYEPFITYARYPKGRCSPLDITEETYVVNIAKSLIEDETFRCVKEFIERDVKTERCRNVLELARQRLQSISKG